MKKKSKKDQRKSEAKLMFFIILIALVMFIISTYAWFTTQKNVSITNLKGTVEVAEGLEISLDAAKWSNGLVIGTDKENGEVSIIDDAYTGNSNISPSEMLPVSTLGLASDSTSTGIAMLRGKITNSKELSNIQQMIETDTNASSSTYPGYFAFDIFLKNSSKTDVDDVLQLNYDSSLQITEEEKSSTGLQNTARVAFAKYSGTSDVMDSQSTILFNTAGVGTGAAAQTITDVAIWEPNSSDHVDYIVQNNNNITWSTVDKAKYATNSDGFGASTQMPTYALRKSAIGKTIADVYKWDGSEATLQKQNVLQTTKTSTTDYTIKEGVQNLVSTSDGSTSFTIPANKICRIRVYLWLEGQDVDCINYASHGGGVTVNIGLVKGSTIGTTEATDTD